MKIEFIDNTPHITPCSCEEEDQLFDWYEKHKSEQIRAVISFEWAQSALANDSTSERQLTIPDVIKAACKHNQINAEKGKTFGYCRLCGLKIDI